uniref:Uncharacterized protein n=1 Tax=Paramormyrops kingsleyae TaxID=1676925 RepID=A0A3B3RBI7_9TELE
MRPISPNSNTVNIFVVGLEAASFSFLRNTNDGISSVFLAVFSSSLLLAFICYSKPGSVGFFCPSVFSSWSTSFLDSDSGSGNFGSSGSTTMCFLSLDQALTLDFKPFVFGIVFGKPSPSGSDLSPVPLFPLDDTSPDVVVTVKVANKSGLTLGFSKTGVFARGVWYEGVLGRLATEISRVGVVPLFSSAMDATIFLISDVGVAPLFTSDVGVIPLLTSDIGVVPLLISDVGVVPVFISDVGVILLLTSDIGVVPLLISDVGVTPLFISDVGVIPLLTSDIGVVTLLISDVGVATLFTSNVGVLLLGVVVP